MSAKYKNPTIWAKFGFQVDDDVANWYSSLVCYGGHFESKIATKIQKSSNLGEIWFPSRFWCWELISMVWEPYYDPLCRNIHHSMWQLWGGLKKFKMVAVVMVTKVQNGRQIQKSSDLGKIWFPSRLWCCELIFIVGLLWCSELDETFQKFCLTCAHIILRLRNFRMAAVATRNVKNLKCSELDET